MTPEQLCRTPYSKLTIEERNELRKLPMDFIREQRAIAGRPFRDDPRIVSVSRMLVHEAETKLACVQ